MTPPERPHVAVQINARFEEIDLVDAVATAWLSAIGLRGVPRDLLVLGVHEAVVNAARHGCRLAPEKSVEVVFERRNNEAVIRVQDEGDGFDPEALPDPLAPENLLRTSGRGLLLMRTYADAVDFDFSTGTRVELRRKLPGPGESEEE